MDPYLYPSVRVLDRCITVQLLENVIDLRMSSIPCGRETSGSNYHPLRELPKPVPGFLLIQRFLCPFFDEGGILDLLPPIGFLPNGVRESAHPHFENLAPVSYFDQVAKSRSDKGKPHRSWVFLAPII